MALVNFNSDQNIGTTSCDGYASRFVSNSTWFSLRGSPGTAGSATSGTSSPRILTGTTSGRFTGIYRSFFLFDTSSIPDDATITSAKLCVQVTTKSEQIPGSSYAVVNCTTGSNTNIAKTDYQLAGTTLLSDAILGADIITSISTVFNEFILNSTGLDYINKTGITKLCIREATYDIADSPPSWLSNKDCRISITFAENSSYKPYLEVTYTEAGGNVNNDNFFLVI